MRLSVRLLMCGALAVALLGACERELPPERVAFTASPSGSIAATSLLPAVQVAFLAADGSVARSADHSPVSLRLVAADTTRKLVGAIDRFSREGVATFDSVAIRKSGTYNLRAISSLGTIESDEFQIIAGPPSGVLIDAATAFAGIPFTIHVRLRDDYRNATTGAATITIAADTASRLEGTFTRPIVQAAAAFDDLVTTRSGLWRMVAMAPGLAPDTTFFGILPRSPHHLAWIVQPSNATAGQRLPAMQLEVQDQYDNPVQATTLGWGGCTAVLGNNPTGANLILVGAGNQFFMVRASAYNNALGIDRAGDGFTLIVTCRQLYPGTAEFTSQPSASFNVAP